MLNLVGNAIKFTDTGSVTIRTHVESTENEEAQWTLAVKDTGTGIEESQHSHVFDVFSQADSSISRSFGGTGIGISISYSLAKLMGGDIALSSELGKGSTFSVTLRMRCSARQTPSRSSSTT